MALELGVRTEGTIKIQTGKEERVFKNAVLNTGRETLFNRMMGGSGDVVPRWLHFGTGESLPSENDKGLEDRATFSKKEATEFEYGGFVDAGRLTAYSDVTIQFDYSPGELTGVWSEIGLSFDSEYEEPYNRALIQDENRAVTPLVVKESDPVTVFVVLRIYLDGWGSLVSLPELGTQGTMQFSSSVSSSSNGIWPRGFPVSRMSLGNVGGILSGVNVEEGKRSFRFFIHNQGEWSASRIELKASNGTTHITINLNNPIQKPDKYILSLTIDVVLKKGENL